MTCRGKVVGLVAAVVCLIVVPVTLGAFPGGLFGTRDAAARTGARHHHRGGRRVRGRRRAVARHLPTGPPAVTVTLGAPLRAVPRSYLGLSIEYWGMPLFERRMGAFSRVLDELHARGDGPLILRVGGDSADRSFWDPVARRTPQWMFRLGPGWLHSTDRLLARTPIRLILDLNLVTASPLRSVAWARAAETGLRRGSISAFEVGNEPDIYDRPYWLATIARVGAVLPAAISARSYVREFAAYARDLRRIAPGVPLMGPAIATPRSLPWLKLLAVRGRRWLGALTAHRYPYSACLGFGSQYSPSVPRLLSETATAGNAAAMRPAVLVAHRAGLPLRMTELNSITCGGRPGISNTFATALWAPDALFELMRAGVDGVNVHVRADTINAAMVPAGRGLRIRPLLYGLMLFSRALAPGGKLLSTLVHPVSGDPGDVKAWALRGRSGETRVLLINKGRRSVIADVRMRAFAPASVERLRAASARATSGVTLAGQRLGADGRWHGRLRREWLPPAPHGYSLALPAHSAALLQAP